MRFSVGVSFLLSFSRTITCKKGVSPGLALHCARHTAGVHPTARVKGEDPLADVHRVRHTLSLPSSVTVTHHSLLSAIAIRP